ncbi:MAG: DUF4149 domain-containing protein [Acidobacteria bacterium]|nr:DUF4149 domain-containing protein [Acidobacteriota bacterium]
MKVLSNIRLLFISLWLGASVFFIGVAQSAFAVLPERELAGAIVSRTLAILNYSGLIIALLLLALTLIGQKNVNKLWLWIERFALVILAAACAVGQFVIAWWLLLVRQEMNKPLEQVAVDDPLRIQFNALHQYSEWVLLSGMVAALIVFFIIANRQTVVGKKDNVVDFDFQDQFKM